MEGPSAAHYRLAGAALASVLATAVAWRFRPLLRVAVTGESMSPTLGPGDRLLVMRRFRPRPGQVVTLVDPRSGRVIVKRVASVSVAGVEVTGDNPEASTDSRVFGNVPAGALRGRVVYRYFPESRRGRL